MIKQNDNDLAYAIVEQMGLGFEFRNCSCGQLPCARLRPIVNALAEREAEVRAALTKAIADERAACAQAAKDAKLPKGYQWGHDAMEQFNFGKERAALAIKRRASRRDDTADTQTET